MEWQPQDRQARLGGQCARHRSTSRATSRAVRYGRIRNPLLPGVGWLPQIEVEIQSRMLDVLDDNRKTVARIRIEDGPGCGHRSSGFMETHSDAGHATALRGYDAAYERLLRIIESRPGLKRSTDGLQAIVLQELGMAPPCDASQFSVELEQSVRADNGARQIHSALLDIMVANEPGMRADLDPEFLHNYRVSLRRTRSLLAQIKDIFPVDAVTFFRTEFRWLARHQPQA